MANNDIIVSEMTPASQINTGDLMIMTQPDARSETGYSTKSGTVLQVSNKMLKGTNYETDLPSFTNKNVLGGMEELKGDIFNLLPVDEASGSIANFETELAAPLQSVLVNVVATGGNGTADNPISINGYSEANITRCGVNLWDEETVVSSGHLISRNYTPCKGGETYYLKAPVISPQTFANGFRWYDENKIKIGFDLYPTGNQTLTAPSNACFFKFELSSNYGTTYNNDISINYPSTDTTYHAYNGQTYTIAFGQTVYGGVLDVTRGKLTVTHGYVPDMSAYNFSKELAGGKYHYYSGQIPNAKHFDFYTLSGTLCSSYPTITRQAVYAGTLGCAFDNTSRFYIYNADYDNESTTAIDVKNNMSGVSVAYELATPFDIDLTPEVISAIVGENNVFADCGGDTSVKFKDTIQHYIDKKIAQTQALIL